MAPTVKANARTCNLIMIILYREWYCVACISARLVQYDPMPLIVSLIAPLLAINHRRDHHLQVDNINKVASTKWFHNMLSLSLEQSVILLYYTNLESKPPCHNQPLQCHILT